jgi:hypothetical protein
MADDDNTNNTDNRDILEEQSKSLEELVAEMRQQSRNVEESVDANVDVEKSIKALEGSLGIDSNENSAALRESFANVNAVMQEQVALQEQGLPFDQELLNSAQDQLEIIKAGVKSEEDRREAIKKQDEANSLLGKMAKGIEGFGGKVKESGGFLAGIAGLATLLLNPQAFAVGLTKILNFVGDMVKVVEHVFAGEFGKAGELLKENGGAIAGILGGLLIMNLGKVIRGVSMLVRGFKIFRLFMLGTMVPMLTGAFTAMITAMTPIFAAMAPVLLPILAIAAIFGVIGLALAQIRDAMGFTSVFDVMSLGIAHLQDAFGRVVNLIGGIVNFVLGLVEKFGRFLGFDIDLPEIPKMSTNNAATEKVRLQEKAKQAEIEKQQQAKQAPVDPLGDLKIPTVDSMEMPAYGKLLEVPPLEVEERVVLEPAEPISRGRRGMEKKVQELEAVKKIENTVQQAPITTGEQISVMSAENLLANMPATTENNVVNQVQTTNTSNSGNKQTTVIQGYRPSRVGDFLSGGYGRFAR